MPGTVRGAYEMVQRENVRSRPRKGLGGGREYRQSDLPQVTQDYLLRKAIADAAEHLPEPVAPTAKDLTEVKDDQRPMADWQRTIRDGRLTVLAYWESLVYKQGMRSGKAAQAIVKAAKEGTLPPNIQTALANALARHHGDQAAVSYQTLYRWEKLRTTSASMDELAPPAPPQVPKPDWMPLLLSLYQRPGKQTVAKCVRKEWPTRYPDRPAPALRTAQRYISELPVEIRNWGRMGRRAMRSVQPFVRRTTDGLWPMDVVTVDGHAAPCYVLRPDSGRRIHPEITTYVDVATRRIIGVSCWWVESQYAIWLALRHVILDPAQGIPAIQYSDNGAYRGAEHQAVLDRLGIVPMYAEAYRAQARGLIERINSSVWVPLARTQPTYCGSDVDQELFKQALKRVDNDGTGVLTWPQWLTAMDGAIAEYNRAPHSSLGKNTSPDQAWARAVDDGWTPTILDGDDLHDLLPAAQRKCMRGEVRLPWGTYFHNDLRYLHDREVRVAYDPADGARAWISDMAGRLICIAKRDANARRYVPESQLEHARQRRKQERIRRLEQRIEHVRADETPLIEGQALDLPDLVLTTTNGRLINQPPTGTPDAEAIRQRLEQDMAMERTPLDGLNSDPKRYEAWKDLKVRVAGGYEPTRREAEFLSAFAQAPYCQIMQELEGDFDRVTKTQ